MNITNPRFVKKANQWVVTIVEINDKGKTKCSQVWFSTQDEAYAYKLEQEKKSD